MGMVDRGVPRQVFKHSVGSRLLVLTYYSSTWNPCSDFALEGIACHAHRVVPAGHSAACARRTAHSALSRHYQLP